jgi:hypothetical protein
MGHGSKPIDGVGAHVASCDDAFGIPLLGIPEDFLEPEACLPGRRAKLAFCYSTLVSRHLTANCYHSIFSVCGCLESCDSATSLGRTKFMRRLKQLDLFISLRWIVPHLAPEFFLVRTALDVFPRIEIQRAPSEAFRFLEKRSLWSRFAF